MTPEYVRTEHDHADAAEEKLRRMLERAGFHNYSQEHEIDLGMTLGIMRSAFFFDDPNGHYEGICICLDGGRPPISARVIVELRRRFFEIIEIRSEDLGDIEAMRKHFFRLARALLGRDPALLVRDDRSWFSEHGLAPIGDTAATVRSPNSCSVPLDSWKECIELLEPRWRALAHALLGAGIPGPTDVDWEIPADGRVGDRRAVMVWQEADDYIALVADRATGPAQIPVSEDSDAMALAELLRSKLLALR